MEVFQTGSFFQVYFDEREWEHANFAFEVVTVFFEEPSELAVLISIQVQQDDHNVLVIVGGDNEGAWLSQFFPFNCLVAKIKLHSEGRKQVATDDNIIA